MKSGDVKSIYETTRMTTPLQIRFETRCNELFYVVFYERYLVTQRIFFSVAGDKRRSTAGNLAE